MKKKIEIVSLGENCLPRSFLTRGGVKPSKAENELTGPFDLVSHKIENIIHYLETDFEDYLNDIYFQIIKRNIFDFRKKGRWMKKDGTIFPHDKDCQINDREKLETRIKNRINNFRTILKSETPILFVLNLRKNSNPEFVDILYKTIEKICSHKKFRLLVIDFYDIAKEYNPEIYFIKLPLPYEEYDAGWCRKKWKETDFAKYIEACVSKLTQQYINKEFYEELKN